MIKFNVCVLRTNKIIASAEFLKFALEPYVLLFCLSVVYEHKSKLEKSLEQETSAHDKLKQGERAMIMLQ